MDQTATGEQKLEKFNKGVDATANFVKAIAEPVANLVGSMKKILPKRKKKEPDLTETKNEAD